MEGAVRRNLGAQAINENGAVGHRSVEGPETDSPVNSLYRTTHETCASAFSHPVGSSQATSRER